MSGTAATPPSNHEAALAYYTQAMTAALAEFQKYKRDPANKTATNFDTNCKYLQSRITISNLIRRGLRDLRKNYGLVPDSELTTPPFVGPTFSPNNHTSYTSYIEDLDFLEDINRLYAKLVPPTVTITPPVDPAQAQSTITPPLNPAQAAPPEPLSPEYFELVGKRSGAIVRSDKAGHHARWFDEAPGKKRVVLYYPPHQPSAQNPRPSSNQTVEFFLGVGADGKPALDHMNTTKGLDYHQAEAIIRVANDNWGGFRVGADMPASDKAMLYCMAQTLHVQDMIVRLRNGALDRDGQNELRGYLEGTLPLKGSPMEDETGPDGTYAPAAEAAAYMERRIDLLQAAAMGAGLVMTPPPARRRGLFGNIFSKQKPPKPANGDDAPDADPTVVKGGGPKPPKTAAGPTM